MCAVIILTLNTDRFICALAREAQMPFINVSIWKVFCRERETIVGKDHLGLAGAVIVDGKPHAFVEPAWPITRNQSITYGHIQFSGYSESLRIGLVLRAWDIDNNDKWVRYRGDVSKVTSALATAVEHLPVVGDIAGFILEHWPTVVDIFVDLDDNDELLKWAGYLDIPPSPPTGNASSEYEVRFARNDPTGFSDWDYSLFFVITASNPLPFTREPDARRSLAPKKGTKRDHWHGRWESPNCIVSISRSPEDFTLMKIKVESRDGRFPATEEYSYISPIERINTAVPPPSIAPLQKKQAIYQSMGRLDSIVLDKDKTNWCVTIPDASKPKTSGGDVVFLQKGLLEMFDVYLNGNLANQIEIRYLRPASANDVALPLDETLQKNLV